MDQINFTFFLFFKQINQDPIIPTNGTPLNTTKPMNYFNQMDTPYMRKT